MPRTRVNPFKPGTPAHAIYGKFRAARLKANASYAQAERFAVEANAEEAKAAEFEKALQAIGAEIPSNAPRSARTPQLALPSPIQDAQ